MEFRGSQITSTPNKSEQQSPPNIEDISLCISSVASTTHSIEQENSSCRRSSRKKNISTKGDTSIEGLDSEEYEESVLTESSWKRSKTKSATATEYSLDGEDLNDFDVFIKNIKKINYSGSAWQIFRPVDENSVYAEILRNPRHSEEVALNLIRTYDEHPKSVVIKILQFFVDLCCYQNFDVKKHYDFNGLEASSRVLTQMEKKIDSNLIKYKRYLLGETRPNLIIIFQKAIYNFIDKMIWALHENKVLYDSFFSPHIFAFIRKMSFCGTLRSIRHTGCIIAVKMLTGIASIQSRLIKYSAKSKEIQQLDEYMQFFYLIFVKNCLLPDKKCFLLRQECASEMKLWVEMNPKFFLSHFDCFTALRKLILDESKSVRLAALKTCESMLIINNLHKYLSVKEIISAIGSRLNDIENEVTILALEVLLVVSEVYISLIPNATYKEAFNLIFFEDIAVAEKAAKFVINFIRQDKNDRRSILLEIAKLSEIEKFAPYKPLLVEACLDYLPELTNWQKIVDLLYKYPGKHPIQEVIFEAVHQKLTGRPTKLRIHPKVINVDYEDHRKIAKAFLPRMQELLEHFDNDPKMIVNVLNVILSLEYSELPEQFNEYFEVILENVILLFQSDKDVTVLEASADLMLYISSNVENLARKIQDNLSELASEHMECVVNLLQFQNKLDKEESDKLVETSSKLAILFKRFNFLEFINVEWKVLMDIGNEPIILKNLIVCCEWILIWSLRSLLTQCEKEKITKPIREKINKLTMYFTDFREVCFTLLRNYTQSHNLEYGVFMALTELHRIFAIEMSTHRRHQAIFSKQQVNLNEYTNDLIAFLNKHVFNCSKWNDYQRKLCLVRFNELVYTEVLHINFLSHIYKHYYSHNKHFGALMERSMACLAEQKNFHIVMLETLRSVYATIYPKYNVVSADLAEAKELKYLAKQFSLLKIMKSPHENAKLFHFAINYAMEKEQHLEFLYFVTPFVRLLNLDGIDTVITFLKAKLNNKLVKKDVILYFHSALQKQKHLGQSRKPVRDSELEAEEVMEIDDNFSSQETV